MDTKVRNLTNCHLENRIYFKRHFLSFEINKDISFFPQGKSPIFPKNQIISIKTFDCYGLSQMEAASHAFLRGYSGQLEIDP
jgi:hypothetical protein